MTYKKLYLTVIYFCVFCFSIFGQNDSNKPETFETIIESIIEDIDEESVMFSMLEDLESLYENPLDINSATKEDLEKLFILNEIQITNLIDYRTENGEIISIFEINNIEGFNRDILEKIEPFITFKQLKKNRIKDTSIKFASHQLLLRTTKVIQKQKGYKSIDESPPKYEGNPKKFYTRYQFKLSNKIAAGFTAEKDPGEAFFSGSNKNGFDFYSGHFSINFNNIVSNLTIGDYFVRSGQGLVIWQGFGTGKSSDVLNISKTGSGIRPYTSTDENRYFRGISTKFNFRNYELQTFFSKNNKDANLIFPDTTEYPTHFTSLQNLGYHRTVNEITDKNSITETSAGAIFSFRKNKLKVGATFLFQNFNLPFIREKSPYNFFRFRGNINLNYGIDYRFVSGQYQLFGEAAISKSKGKAFLQGAIMHLHDQAVFSFMFRHFDKNYHALSGNSLSEGSGNINETGFYSGLKLLPAKKIKILVYTDFYKNPWLSYNTFAPSVGSEFFVQFEYIHSEKLQLYIRYKNEEKKIKIAKDNKYINSTIKTSRARFHAQFDPEIQFKFKTRVEFSFFSKNNNENGFMICQDIYFMPEKTPFKAQMRIAYINTSSYHTRIYVYENDLLFNYSMPAYYGKSIRLYLNIKYKLTHNIDFWAKISNSSYSDRNTIGSGFNEIAGKNITEVKIQSRLRF